MKLNIKHYRRYIRYFVAGFIFAALVLGSMAIKLAQPGTPAEPCQPYWGGPPGVQMDHRLT